MNDLSSIVMRRRLRRRFPFGMVAGLLAGSLATLVGVATGIDPFAITLRALVSGVVVGMVVSLGAAIVRVANLEPEVDSSARPAGRAARPARGSLPGPARSAGT